MYVAVKGGEAAILASIDQNDHLRRGDTRLAELDTDQIREQLRLAVARVMAEGSLYDPDLAALAVKQAAGDLIEAIFLLRAYRTTLPRFGASEPVDTTAMALQRRISATFKDVPGGQILGATYDYTQRLLDFALLADSGAAANQPAVAEAAPATTTSTPRVAEFLLAEGLLATEPDDGTPPTDLTREPLTLPASRAARLQNLARGDEGFLLGLGYSTQRGYGNSHPFAGEIRHGRVSVEFVPEELGFAIEIGEIELTECELFNQFKGSATTAPQFTRGYGLVFGHGERKAMAMALVDRAMQAADLGEPISSAAQDTEFVLYHSDNVEASGFVQHLKLPHYVDFQSELELVRRLRREYQGRSECSGEPE
jgi:alpha-D-ribose 1-methylphosphonate 5-triphosphate synthase subunit PhnI